MAEQLSRSTFLRHTAILAGVPFLRALPVAPALLSRGMAIGGASGFLEGIEAEQALSMAPVALGAVVATTAALVTGGDAEDGEEEMVGVFE